MEEPQDTTGVVLCFVKGGDVLSLGPCLAKSPAPACSLSSAVSILLSRESPSSLSKFSALKPQDGAQLCTPSSSAQPRGCPMGFCLLLGLLREGQRQGKVDKTNT